MDVAGLAFVSLAAAAVVGAFLVWRGLRGKRVDVVEIPGDEINVSDVKIARPPATVAKQAR